MIQRLVSFLRKWRWLRQQSAAERYRLNASMNAMWLREMRGKNRAQLPGWTPGEDD